MSYTCSEHPDAPGCTCKGNACLYRDYHCSFAFTGTDDLHDYISDIAGLFNRKCVGNERISNDKFEGCRWMHGGFVNEFMKLQPFIDARRQCGTRKPRSDGSGTNATNRWGMVFIGHSLGGAIAMVAQQFYGQGYVATFGAPQVFDMAKDGKACLGTGKRIFNEMDPIAGNLFGILAGYWHSGALQE
eukprot:gene55774-36349_t